MTHPDPTNEPVELQTALGRMIMAWAYLEAAIDGICLTLFHKIDVEKITLERDDIKMIRLAAHLNV